MRVEAELDEVRAGYLLALQQRSNKPLSELVADLLAKALDQSVSKSEAEAETEGQKALRILETYGLLGCMEGDGQLSVEYKAHLWRQP